jgi:hypothetical protein
MADESSVTSYLYMDRTTPLGNSNDVDNRRALHTKVKNSALEAIPVYITSGSSPTPINVFNSVASIPSGSETLLLTYTVAAAQELALSTISFSGENIALFNLYKNSVLISTYRTFFGNLNGLMDMQGLMFVATDIIELKVLQNRNSTANYEANLLGVLTNV